MSQSEFCKFQCEIIKVDRIWKEILTGITGVAQMAGGFFYL